MEKETNSLVGPRLFHMLSIAEDRAMQSNEEAMEERYMDMAGAYCYGQFEEALAGFADLVQRGHVRAATYLAEMYLRGEGVSPNVEKGLELLQLAASRGDSTAAFNLGALHRSGDCGVPRDLEKSRHFFLLAKDLGCMLPIEDYLEQDRHQGL